MTIISNPVKYLLSILVLAVLSGCAPLRFAMYARNMTNGTTYLTLKYTTGERNEKKNVDIKFKDSLIDINNKTYDKLNGALKVTTVGDSQILLNIPPHSTISLSDLIYSIYEFADKILIIKNANNTDTIPFNYPYRRIKGLKRKRNSPFNFFYRTILYYDIK
jgi:hypothetical protein